MVGEKSANSDKDRDEPGGDAGEDEGSAPKEGEDGHLKDDQKPTNR